MAESADSTASHGGGNVAIGGDNASHGQDANDSVLARIASTIESRKAASSDQSYVASLLRKGDNAILKKIGEEATETVMAAKDGDKIALVGEVADLWFHCLVLLASRDLGPREVLIELERREGLSGLAEKAQRSKGGRAA